VETPEKTEISSRPEPPRSPTSADAKKLKLGWLPIVISIGALLVSFFSLGYNLGYLRPHEDHDAVAKVLGVRTLLKGFSSVGTNGELVIDIAVINRGNQTEIIRDVFLCYSDSKDFNGRARAWQHSEGARNVQLPRGEKRALRISTQFNSLNTGKRMWLGVAARAIAPNADDTEVVWPVCEINLAPDGNGGSISYNKDQTPLIQIISNKRMPHQRIAPEEMF